MRRRVLVLILLVLFAGVGVYFFTRYCLYVRTADGTVLTSGATYPGDTFSLRFIHSVQKTPVVENFRITSGGRLELQSTVYQSFGVGLPFLASEGQFAIVGDKFVLQNMGRVFRRISLRTGPEAQLTMLYRGREWPLYRDLPAGSRVDIYVAPFYARWWLATGETE